jgi:16S rRNA (cytidine1402-2'-O)-methyltransferase
MPKLILVPTPIGNLGDITYRALEVLKSADMVLAEDTRTSGRLLNHYDIKVSFMPFHAHNEHRMLPKAIEQLLAGQKLVLLTDAGTPGISDPGFLLVRACVEAGIEVETLPGATAFVPALVNAGLPIDRFCFEGFLPHKKGRQKRLQALVAEERTIVFYESPHRIVKTLLQLAEVLGPDRRASISREISKLHEETRRGSLAELAAHFEHHGAKGEFVLVVAGAA